MGNEVEVLPPLAEEDKGIIHNAIEIHLRNVGPREWWRIRQQFPKTFPEGKSGERKLMRWIAQVREKSGLENVSRDKVANSKRAKDVRTARVAAAKDIPTAPPPAYFVDPVGRRPESRSRKIDFLGEVNLLFHDAKKLRAWATAPDPDSPDGEKIRVPAVFDISIKRRLDVINAALSIQAEVWNLERMERFYTAIIDVIGDVSPEAQREIMLKLHDLNNELGMTINAEPGA